MDKNALYNKTYFWQVKQEMSLKKTNGIGLKKGKKVLVHKFYRDDGKLIEWLLSRISGHLFWRK